MSVGKFRANINIIASKYTPPSKITIMVDSMAAQQRVHGCTARIINAKKCPDLKLASIAVTHDPQGNVVRSENGTAGKMLRGYVLGPNASSRVKGSDPFDYRTSAFHTKIEPVTSSCVAYTLSTPGKATPVIVGVFDIVECEIVERTITDLHKWVSVDQIPEWIAETLSPTKKKDRKPLPSKSPVQTEVDMQVTDNRERTLLQASKNVAGTTTGKTTTVVVEIPIPGTDMVIKVTTTTH